MKTDQQKLTVLKSLSLALLAMGVLPASVYAVPTSADASVVSGSAVIVDTDANTTTINQASDIAEINWNNFDIGTGQTVQFNVPRAESLSINRVTSGIASTIAGNISSNGQVYLINEHGLTFGSGANINVGTLIASTIDTFNTQADANQYAEIKFEKFGNFGSADKLVVVSPFISFVSDGLKDLDMSGVKEKLIYSANTAHLKTDVNNNVTVELPDVQADIDVPDGKALGISAVTSRVCLYGCSESSVILNGERIEMIAKAASLQDNMKSLINLGDNSIFNAGVKMVQQATNPTDTAIVMESVGNIYLGGELSLSTLFKNTNNHDIRIVAGENLNGIMYKNGSSISATNLYIEANNITLGLDYDNFFVPGKVTIVQREGTLLLRHDSGFGAMAGGGLDMNILVNNTSYASEVELRAPNITFMDSVSWTSKTQTVNDYRKDTYVNNVCYEYIGCFKTQVIPSSPEFVTSDLHIFATETVTVNAGINLNGLGSVNVEATTLNINPAVAANVDPINFTLYTPPPPPPAPVVPEVPAVPENPVVVEETFEELAQNLNPSIVEKVKEKFFERFSKGAKEAMEQQVNTVTVEVATVAEAPQVNNDALNVEAPQAASCSGGVCAVVDQENNLVTVDEAYMKKRDLQLKTLADRVVNLTGMVDVFKF